MKAHICSHMGFVLGYQMLCCDICIVIRVCTSIGFSLGIECSIPLITFPFGVSKLISPWVRLCILLSSDTVNIHLTCYCQSMFSNSNIEICNSNPFVTNSIHQCSQKFPNTTCQISFSSFKNIQFQGLQTYFSKQNWIHF